MSIPITYNLNLEIDRYMRWSKVKVDKVELLEKVLAEFGDNEKIKGILEIKIAEQKMQDYIDKYYDDIEKQAEEEQKKKDAEKVECQRCKKLYTKKGIKSHEKKCIVGLKEVKNTQITQILEELMENETDESDSN